jgi:uncharacterized protein
VKTPMNLNLALSCRRLTFAAVVLLGVGTGTAVSLAQPRGHGPGRGAGSMNAGEGRADMAVFHYLLDHRTEIRRSVTNIPGGVETLTESDVPAIAAKIQEHVQAMYARMKEGRPIHIRDPLFAELFRNADKVEAKIVKTPKGLRVTETSQDAYVTALIRSHAQVVSGFLANGHAEMMKDHALPARR